jgi:calpain-15
MTSLFNDGIGKFDVETRKSLSTEIEWRRIQDCYSKREITIAENVKPGDVSQGQIGDCYFMATLSALAAFHPQIISDMFITKEFNEAGIYAMKVYVNGHRQVVVVDDYIPYYKWARAPAFAKKETLNIWPILIEKAWAKVCWCYEGIISGHAKEALEFLLPYQNEDVSLKYSIEDAKKIWIQIHGAIKERHIITCSGNKDGTGETIKNEEKIVTNIGLITNHCYAITGIYSFSFKGEKINLLKILNPWNSQEFKGRWHDRDERWCKEIMNYVGFYQKTAGEFYISLTTFCCFFTSINFCKVDKSLQSSTIKLSHKKESFWLARIKLYESSRLTIKINQIIKRVFSKSLNYQPSHSRILVGRVKENLWNDYEYTVGEHCRLGNESFWVETIPLLRKGIYIVYLELDWNTSIISSFSLTVLGKDIELSETSTINYPNFLTNCIKDYAQKQPGIQ